MDVPLILHVSAWSHAAPLAAGLLAHRRLTSPRVWIMFWCAIYLIQAWAARYLGARHLNNHFLTYVVLPVQGAIIFWALSHWQKHPVARLTLRLLIPPFVIAFVLITLSLEELLSFSSVAEPLYSILALGAAVTTLLTRSYDTDESLMRQDWFWICIGLILHFGALAVLTPLARNYLQTDMQLVMRAYQVRAYINTLAFVIIAFGIYSPSGIRPGHSS